MLKLLKKSEIDSAKAQDRQREINEGIKLAGRVDALREAQATEEANLEKFRRESIFKINEEIVSITENKNVLLKEVSDLEDRKRLALLPLDAEWDKVKEKQEELTQYALTLQEDSRILEESKGEYGVELELLEVEKKRICDERNRSIKALADSDEKHEQARKVLKEAQSIKDSAIQLKDAVTSELIERDAVVASKERDLENKVNKFDKEVKALDRERIKLDDMRATLERAMRRIKK